MQAVEIMEEIQAQLKEMERSGFRKKILITDLTPRDGQQCKLATRVRTDDLLPLCEKLDKVGFYAVEVWGGATYDVCLRYLKEDPWERLRRIKEVMPNTKLQMLFRGQNIVGYRPKSDKLVYKFVERSIANGITVFRVFDALNDNRNIQTAVKAIKELGGEAHAEISYTRSPVHTIEKWVEYALEIAEMGADWLSFKDATGIIMPLETYTIIKRIKEATGGRLPVLLHNHDMSGTAIVNHMMAILAGVDMVDTVLSPLAFGSSHPATESVVAMLEGTPFDTGLDLKKIEECAEITKHIRKKYKKYETEYAGVNAKVLIHKIPGGMISNMVAQLIEANAIDKIEEALEEVPNVERDLGYPPLLTPSSQIVGVQAVLNVISGERYKVITKEVRDYVEGKYGKPPGPISKELAEKILGSGKEPDFSIRAADLADPTDWDKAYEETSTLLGREPTDEEVLLYALFPMQAKDYFTAREKGELTAEPIEELAEATEVKPGTVPGAAPVEFEVIYHGEKFKVKVEGVSAHAEPGKPRKYYVRVDGKLEEVQLTPQLEAVPSGGVPQAVVQAEGKGIPKASQPGDATAPMPGRVVRILVEEGQPVNEGQTVAIVEAMKMENEIHAPITGVVKKIFAKPGDNVTPDDALLRIEPVKPEGDTYG
ncbi:2-oxoglutarate carboxylase large subunit [Hydrogenobacter sp. T-2]|uniref:2-oxoglutarate carboxylase large subunit n=1 Tax=Pampinifervens diazotrophicum TaxID=1632018 RepID=UPI002B25E2B5|nr:2-oxoglutarate carboxylase large subunit [Hydrogenobacter sp. T-2]WPM32272.1 2-oxoglutarate carboxylase large subunit [Hydrogenobacter sp. T-2]